MPTIYGLYSTRNNVVKYVGRTTRDVRQRYAEHYRNDRQLVLKVYEWIKGERWRGYDVGYVVLSECARDQLDFYERYWIKRTSNSTNERLNYSNEANSPLVVSVSRSFIENWNGWIGIRYFFEKEAWQVCILIGTTYLTLRGDGGTIHQMQDTYRGRFGRTKWRGDLCFSDSKAAIDARNRFRDEHDKERVRLGDMRVDWPQDYCERYIGWAERDAA